MAAVHELGYAPNFSARALMARRTNTIGVVIPTMENAIFARGVQAFQEELVRHGYTLLIASSGYEEALEAEQIRTLVTRGADALLLIGYHRAPEIYEFVARRGVPLLVAWACDPALDPPAIGFDNAAAMAALARHALGLGHRRLGMISAPATANDRARGRIAGVRRAMHEAGLSPEALSVVETPYGIDSGADAFRQIVSTAPETTLVLCGNDVLALGALRAAKATGMQVPCDVSVTGFDDIDIALLAEPALTTVHVPHREMGRRAADLLLARLRGDDVPRTTALTTHLCLRASLGPPRGMKASVP